jgi:hypothetical protein
VRTGRRFCIFILTYGRPDDLLTLDTIRRAGYTGDWYLVIGNDDPAGDGYRQRYGEHVLTFDKAAIADTFDRADLSTEYRTVVFARNACFDLALALGYDYFLELDDDYYDLQHRYEQHGHLTWVWPNNLDAVCDAMLDFLEASGAACVAFAQGGDFIGGLRSQRWQDKLLRKAMNALFLRTSDTWRFPGRINEDVSAYTVHAHRGRLFFTTMYCNLNQTDTQQQAGGMTDAYRERGTYIKSFYSVMMCPSAVKIATLHAKHPRIHHQVQWGNCAPLILAETTRKAR